MSEAWPADIQCLLRSRCDTHRTGVKWLVVLTPQTLTDAAQRFYDQGYFLEDITGLDTADGLMAIYHFDHYTNPGRVACYVMVSPEAPQIPSIGRIFTGARWHERECHDFFGIPFTDHPNLTPLLLPEDMDQHPLIKDETARVPLKTLIDPGEIVFRDPRFTLLDKIPHTEAGQPAPDTHKE